MSPVRLEALRHTLQVEHRASLQIRKVIGEHLVKQR